MYRLATMHSAITTQQDLESLNLSLNEAIDVAQNHPLWRMMSIRLALCTHRGACAYQK